MKVRIQKLDERAILPTYGTEYSAGADLYALCENAVTIGAGKTEEMRALAAEMPRVYVSYEHFMEQMQAEKEIQIVTTLRQNALLGFVSKESPLGSAIMGKKVGDRALVKVSDTMSYYVVIRALEKGVDNEELPISSY